MRLSEQLLGTLTGFTSQVNSHLEQYSRLKLIAVAIAASYTVFYIQSVNRSDKPVSTRLKTNFFYYLRKLPFLRKKIQDEISAVEKDIVEAIHGCDEHPFIVQLPAGGIKKDELCEMLQTYSCMEGPAYLEGKVSGAVFSDEADAEEMEIYCAALRRFAWSNPLWPKLFPGVRKMEAEIVRMCAHMLHGDESVCGTVSTGGTISILLACLAHRNKALKKGVDFPEMLLPTSAHAAFTKAAEVFRMKIVPIPVDSLTYKANVSMMEHLVSSRTAMLVGSAPNYPFGTIDDIEAISKIGSKYDIPVHVDACLGGFILPFVAPSQLQVAPFDFRLPGVSSISVDTHKYGLAPKGSSVILYKSTDYLHNQYFCDSDWQGGIYASSTLEGSRAGLNIALCWTSLLYHGISDYEKNANQIVNTASKIRHGIASIEELTLQGTSDVCIVSFTSSVIDMQRFHDAIGKKGWQLANLQFPSGVHIMVTMNHTKDGVAEQFVQDCADAVRDIVVSPDGKAEGQAALYGMAQKIPDRSIVKEFAFAYLDACYSVKNK